MKLRALIVVCVTSLVPSIVSAQALTSLASVRVGYITRKNTVKPQGELKEQIDALDAKIAEASRLGKNGELRRLFAKASRCSTTGRGPTPSSSRTRWCCAPRKPLPGRRPVMADGHDGFSF